MNRKEQAAMSRRILVDAATDCFTTQGYDGTTVAAILDRAGMARGALYHYFPDGKREIFDEVFNSINDEYHRRRDALTTLESPMARIRAGIRVFLDLCTEERFARIALVEGPRLIPGEGGLGSSFELLRLQLREAISTHEIQESDVDATAMAIYGAIRGAGEHVTTSSHRTEAARAAAVSLDRMLEGLR